MKTDKEHKMQSPKLRSTKDYSLFKLTNKNRPIDARHVKKLSASMQAYGWLPSFPMTCKKDGDKLVIEDGQHRFALAKELGLAVWFVDLGNTQVDIPTINAGCVPWSFSHYIGSFAGRGLPDYQELIEFHAEHQVPLLTAAAILAGTCSDSNVYAFIRAGTYKIKDRDYAGRVAAIYSELRKMNKARVKEPMLQAIAAVARVKDIDLAALIKNIHRSPELLKEHSTRDGALEVLESIYNFGRRIRVPLKIAAENAMRERNVIKKK